MDKKRKETGPDQAGLPPAKRSSQELQQQIQKQLTETLTRQLEEATARGQQAKITPEDVKQTAAAMVQCAAQAQAVVAAAKSRGDGLVPMNAAQIAQLSQIQAKAIVNARPNNQTPEEKEKAISLQCQALIHAHTQAQIQAGIYKDDKKPAASSVSAPHSVTAVASAAAAAAQPVVLATLTADQRDQHNTLVRRQELEMSRTSDPSARQALKARHDQEQADLHASFRQEAANVAVQQPSATSPQFLAQLKDSLDDFWKSAMNDINKLEDQTEQDFKNHNDLPLARIKRIMKSDEDVRMISAEAPVLFAKACELFILDLSIRSWNYSQLHKRRTLQKEDVKEAIQKTDVFDFLVDVIQ